MIPILTLASLIDSQQTPLIDSQQTPLIDSQKSLLIESCGFPYCRPEKGEN
jgi:hypothetical protein